MLASNGGVRVYAQRGTDAATAPWRVCMPSGAVYSFFGSVHSELKELRVRRSYAGLAVQAGREEMELVIVGPDGVGRSAGGSRVVSWRLAGGGLAYSVDGSSAVRGIFEVQPRRGRVLDRRPGVNLRSLRIVGRRVTWRHLGRAQSSRIGGPPQRPGRRCAVPRSARPEPVGYGLIGFWMDQLALPFRDGLYICQAGRESPPRHIGVLDADSGPNIEDARGRAVLARHFDEVSSHRAASHLSLHDLFTGRAWTGCDTEAGASATHEAYLYALRLSLGGQVACLIWHGDFNDGYGEVTSFGSRGSSVLDSGRGIVRESLWLEGATLHWTKDGVERSAAFR